MTTSRRCVGGVVAPRRAVRGSAGRCVSSRWTLAAAAQRRARRRPRRRARRRPRRRSCTPSGAPRPERRGRAAKKTRKKTRSRSSVGVGVELGALRAAAPVDERGEPDEHHRDRREQERGADDRADRDVLGALRAADDRDDRDQRLGHRRPDGGEQAPDRALADREPVAGHSTAFVNSSAPARITAKLAASRTVSIALAYGAALRRRRRRARGSRRRRAAGRPRTSSTRPRWVT